MAKIVAQGDAWSYRASGNTEYVYGTNHPKLFLRQLPEGLVVVRSYVEGGETMVEMVRDGLVLRQWYKHSPITTRQASLLVNRFLADMEPTT
jgi:hypothetical protein